MGKAQERAPEQAESEVDELGPEPDTSSWAWVKVRIHQIEPGSSEGLQLQLLLQTYPQYRDQIMAEAQAHLGNAVVAALQQADTASTMQGTAEPMSAAEVATAVAEETPGQGVDMAAMKALDDDEDAHPTALPEAVPDIKAPPPKEDQATADISLLATNEATVDMLVSVLRAFPERRQEVLEAATKSMSAADIRRALDIADGPIAAKTEEDATPPPEAAVAAEQGPKPGEVPPVAQAAPEPEKEPAWVASARSYNDVQFDLVEEFHSLTYYLCMAPGLGGGATTCPHKVSHWQREHGLTPDGKVGPHTIATARKAAGERGQQTAEERDSKLIDPADVQHA